AKHGAIPPWSESRTILVLFVFSGQGPIWYSSRPIPTVGVAFPDLIPDSGGPTDEPQRARTHCPRNGGEGEGHSGRGRELRNDQEAVRFDQARIHRGAPPLVPRDAFHRSRRKGLDQRGHPL